MSMQFVECMLDIHSKYSELVLSVFGGDQQFYGALDKVACDIEYFFYSDTLFSYTAEY